MVIKVILLLVFFAVMLGIGFYSRKHATDVNGFVLGGRSVGPWLTAFAYGTSYFQRLYLSDMQDSSVTNTDLLPLGLELAMQCLVLCLHGLYWDDVQEL